MYCKAPRDVVQCEKLHYINKVVIIIIVITITITIAVLLQHALPMLVFFLALILLVNSK